MNMNMNILEQEDAIKGAPDNLLLQEAQFPSGHLPQFLVISEIQRRKEMRDRFSAQEQQPEQSVAEQIVTEAVPQMPPQASSMPMQAPQMPPEMMAVQNAPMAPPPQMMAAGGGRMPYPTMAGGGMIPPNSLVEDASKFNPESLYDIDASQMGMANPTNMGIASVLPMAGGGIVRMDEGGYLSAKEGWIPDRYQDEGKGIGSLDYSQIGSDALTAAEVAALALIIAPEPTTTAAGAVLKAGTTAFRAIPPALKSAKAFAAKHNANKRLAALLGIGAIEGYRRLGNGLEAGDVIRSAEASENNNEPVLATEDDLENFLFPKRENALYQGGLVKMQAGTTVPFLSADAVRANLAGKYIKAPEWLNDVEGVLSQEQANLLRDYTSQPQEIDMALIPGKRYDEQGLSTAQREELIQLAEGNNSALTLDQALEAGRTEGGLGLSAYEITEQVKNLDTSTQEAEIQDQIDALEAMKGQTPETFDITESVLRSGERADERAMSQALINLGAGIAAGDISQGFKDAGTAVSDVRQRQEEFQQLAEIRKAEAESKASSDRMTRDISLTTAQIGAYGDLQDQKNAANQLLIQRERAYIDASNTNNQQLIAQTERDFNIAKLAVDINNFDRQLQYNIRREDDLNLRERMQYESVALRAFAPSVLDQGDKLSGSEKAAWKPTSLTMPDGTPDTRPGWTAQRALQDLMEGIRAGMPSEITQSDFDRLSYQTGTDLTGFRVTGSGQ
mgnify:CR=1 FL=1|tara:strand:- start:513 stop:2708 length:2196 start_codon:yes stop_codon:yes gene_type:complete